MLSSEAMATVKTAATGPTTTPRSTTTPGPSRPGLATASGQDTTPNFATAPWATSTSKVWLRFEGQSSYLATAPGPATTPGLSTAPGPATTPGLPTAPGPITTLVYERLKARQRLSVYLGLHA